MSPLSFFLLHAFSSSFLPALAIYQLNLLLAQIIVAISHADNAFSLCIVVASLHEPNKSTYLLLAQIIIVILKAVNVFPSSLTTHENEPISYVVELTPL